MFVNLYYYLRLFEMCIFRLKQIVIAVVVARYFFKVEIIAIIPWKWEKRIFLFRFVWSRYHNYNSNSNNSNSSNNNSVMGIWILDTAKVSSEARKLDKNNSSLFQSLSNWKLYENPENIVIGWLYPTDGYSLICISPDVIQCWC